MYSLPYYKERDSKIIEDFIQSNPFAYLSGCDEKEAPVATQIPLLLEKRGEKSFLVGHMMRNTDHHKAFEKNSSILVVFSADHCYVSGTWYSNPNTPSTWNYMSVHVIGKIRFVDDVALENILQKVSLQFENGIESSPTTFNQLPSDFKKKMLPMIVGFEIEIAKIDHVFKLSQDRDKESYLNIIKHLKERDHKSKSIARQMEMRTKNLFK